MVAILPIYGLGRPDESLRLRIIFRRAIARRMEGDVRRALEGFRTLEKAPSSIRGASILDDALHYEYALALFRANEWNAAASELAQVTDEGPYGLQKSIRKSMSSFAVQVGVFKNRSGAVETKLRLSPRDPRAGFRKAGLSFVVTTGGYASFNEAEREARRLKGEGFPDAIVIP